MTLYYEQHFFGWPRETTYDVVAWTPKDRAEVGEASSDSFKEVVSVMSRTLFCSLLGTLYKDQDLYGKVKEFVKVENMYVYKQYEKCND